MNRLIGILLLMFPFAIWLILTCEKVRYWACFILAVAIIISLVVFVILYLWFAIRLIVKGNPI